MKLFSWFNKKSPKQEVLKIPKILKPCMFSVGDLVHVKNIEDKHKAFKVVQIIDCFSDPLVKIEYFYNNEMFSYVSEEDSFEFCVDPNSTNVVEDIFWTLFNNTFYHEWRRVDEN